MTNKLGPLPWQPFVDENLNVDYKKKDCTFHIFFDYLKEVLLEQIGWDEDCDLTPHKVATYICYETAESLWIFTYGSCKNVGRYWKNSSK